MKGKKKIMITMIFAGVGLLLLLVCVIAVQYAKLPEYVREKNEQLQLTVGEGLDERVLSALEEEKRTVFEGEGINLPFSRDLLDMLNRHWNTELIERGAGLYQGRIDENQTLELLLNPEGRVGQIQVQINSEANEGICREALIKYACFVNTSLSEEQAESAADKAYTEIQRLEEGKELFFFEGRVGFGLRKEEQAIFIYIP